MTIESKNIYDDFRVYTKLFTFSILLQVLFLAFYIFFPFFFDESYKIDMFRFFLMRLFILIPISLLIYKKNWLELIILILLSATLFNHHLLLLMTGNLRVSIYLFPAILVVSWSFATIGSFMLSKIENLKISIKYTITLFILFFLLHFCNPISLILFSGPR